MPQAVQQPTPQRTRPARPLNIAHRGASAEMPENTVAALRRAVELGADMVEVDVHRTRDGALVLMHDATLARTTDVRRVFPARAPWRVTDFTRAELDRLDAGSWKSPSCAGEGVPMLDDVLAMVSSWGVGLQLELKAPAAYPGIVEELVRVLADAARAPGGTVDGIVVQSFDYASMKELKTRAPALRVGLLGAPASEHLPVLGSWADQVNPHHWAADRAYVEAVHAQGMQCCLWTVDRPTAMRRALRLGVDGVITNRPDRLAAASNTRRRTPAVHRVVIGH